MMVPRVVREDGNRFPIVSIGGSEQNEWYHFVFDF